MSRKVKSFETAHKTREHSVNSTRVNEPHPRATAAIVGYAQEPTEPPSLSLPRSNIFYKPKSRIELQIDVHGTNICKNAIQ